MSRLKISLHGTELQTLELEEGREYQVGRGADCDVRLDRGEGISRVHFRIRHDGQNWIADTVSKFAAISTSGGSAPSLTLADGASFQVPPYDFVYHEGALEMAAAASDGFARAGVAPTPSSAPALVPDFDGDDEATAFVAVRLVAYVRFLPGRGQSESEMKLEGGGPWLAGRDDDAAIFLNDPKASRRQFEVSQTSKGWMIKDLGSSNGTALNGKILPANEPLPLRSGDVVSVQSIELAFEARDATFAQKAAALPAVIPFPSSPTMDPAYGASAPIIYERGSVVASGPGGAVVYHDGHDGRDGQDESDDARPVKPNRRVLMIVGAVVLLGLFFALSPSKEPAGPRPGADSPEAKLSKAERQRVQNTYNLAQELFIQKNYDMALAQLETVHRSLPKGFENSLELKERIESAKRTIEEQEANRRQMEALQRQEAQVREIVAKCRPIAAASARPEEIRSCLADAMQLKPDDQEAQQLIEQVDRRKVEADAKAAGQRAYAASSGRGRALWTRAEKLRDSGKRKEAIAAYQAHLKSPYPDPEGLKARSQASIASLRQELESEARALADQAQAALDRGDLKGALDAAIRAQAIDPDSPRAREVGGKAKRELDTQLQSLYADSVVSENFGKLEDAKEKWKKILELDRRGGEYWHKAKSKLGSYGGG